MDFRRLIKLCIVLCLFGGVAEATPFNCFTFFKKAASRELAVEPVVPAMIRESDGLQNIRNQKTKELQKAARHKYGDPREEPLIPRLTAVGVWLVAGAEAAHLTNELIKYPQHILPALLMARLGMEIADGVSAVVHVLLDKYLPTELTNVQAFLRHHVTPELIVKKTYRSMLAEGSPYIFPVFGVASWASWMGYIHPVVAAGIWTAMLAGAHGTNFHAQGHMSGEIVDPGKPLHKQPPALAFHILRKL